MTTPTDPVTLPSLDLNAAERDLCVEALRRAGSIVEAAALLNTTRHGLKRRIIKHRIEWPRSSGPPAAHLPAPTFDSKGDRVLFFADGEDSPCSELTLCLGEMIEESEDDIGGQDFTLRCDGELHDGYRSLEEVEAAFPVVAATLADWKADRLVPFAAVLAEAHRLKGLG